jgi:glycosyltransferase involved in cell wall biosynthesis
VHIRFLIMNAYTVGGTIRTTFTIAGELAKRHDVEIVSVYRMRSSDPALPVPDNVRLRMLTDLRQPTLDRLAAGRSPAAKLRTALVNRPSKLISPQDYRYDNFSVLTDVNLLRYLNTVRDGVLIGTRPGLNLAIAHLIPDQVVRIGQDHVNLASYRRGLRAQIKASYHRLDLLSTLTEGDAEAYRKLLKGRTRIEVFPNAVPDVGGHRATLDDKVVIAAGRLVRQKGFDRLLPAWAEVSKQHPDWQLRIFGSGGERDNLQRQIDELGIGDTAHLMGFTRKLHEEMSRASLYVLSSRQEGFPMVLLEAMGVGLPAVSVDCVSGPSDIIREGVDGHVVPENDTPALAAALSGLMADAGRRKAYGAAALETAARYDAAQIAGRWEQRLEELAAAKHERRGTLAGRAARVIHGRARAKGLPV